MKKFFISIILILILGFSYIYKEELFLFYANNISNEKKVPQELINNQYARNYNYNYVKLTNNLIPNNIDDIKNIYYTILNSGMESFYFYCPNNYKSCTEDVKSIANNQTTLSNINNFVHPYNSFKHLRTKYNDLGKITITIEKNYSQNEIDKLNAKVEEIINIINVKTTDEAKIKAIHDYIIKNSKYDKERSDNNKSNYHSDIAYGPLLEGYGLCGGYTDAATIFLDKLGIKNFKIATDNHIWNAVYVNNTWYHLDLTWDDPVASNGKDILEYNFFLITTKELLNIKTNQHNYNKEVYSEI